MCQLPAAVGSKWGGVACPATGPWRSSGVDGGSGASRQARGRPRHLVFAFLILVNSGAKKRVRFATARGNIALDAGTGDLRSIRGQRVHGDART
ncbi:hypothetical protein GCM10010106_51220 [Thermopolyspora flexuosa]|nr:hypothetical protein GCM10010106_51220 [Thermopolyspora flexuosa]